MKKLLFSIFLIIFMIGGTVSYADSEYNLEVNNGIASSDGAVSVGTKITLTAAPNTGYRFVNWTAGEGTEIDGITFPNTSDTIEFNMPAKDVSITANFTPIVIHTLSVDDGTTTTISEVELDEEVTVTALPPEGYELKSWTITGITEDKITFTNNKMVMRFNMPDSNVILTANVGKIEYDVIYNGNGENVTNIPVNQKKVYGEELILNGTSPLREGYTFDSWNTKEDGTGSVYQVGATYTENAELILYAQWTEIKYLLEVNDGVASASLYVKPGESVTVEVTEVIPNGYEFDKWELVNNPTSSEFGISDLGLESLTFKMPENDVSLTAKLKLINYSITYEGMDGADNASNPSSYTIETADITLTQPTKSGHTFLGWTGTGLEEATKDVTIAKGSTGNRTYTATWKVDSYTLNVNDGSTNTVRQAQVGEEITVTASPLAGYEFVNWTLTNEPTSEFNISDLTQASITFIMPSNNVTLTANVRLKTYTVTWENYDGTVLETDSNVEYGTTPSYDGETPTRESDGRYEYTFNGWSPEISTVTGNITYTAQFTSQINTFVLTVSDGTSTAVQDVQAGETVEITARPLEGYRFVEWDIEEGSIEGIIFPNSNSDISFTMPATNVTLTAKVESIIYKVEYDANGGENAPVAQEKMYGVDFTLSTEEPTKAGWTFEGWTTNQDGTGDKYQPGAVYTVNADLTLYAQWIETKYLLEVNDGVASAKRYVKPGEEVTAEVTEVIPVGYEFEKWEIEGLEGVDTSSTKVTFIMPSNPVKLTAVLKENIEIKWTWNTSNALTKTISLKTNAQTTIDWGDGETSNIINSTSKFSLSHTYSVSGDYHVTIFGNNVTYLDISNNNVSEFNALAVTSFEKLFIYNNNLTSQTIRKANTVVTDESVETTATVDKLLKVGVRGTGNFNVNDDLKITFTTTSIHELKEITLDGTTTSLNNPYDASELVGTHTIIGIFEEKSDIGNLEGEITWNWSATTNLTKTINIIAGSDTVVVWGDGSYDSVLAGSQVTLTHTYTKAGNYIAGLLDSTVKLIDISDSNVTSLDFVKGTELEYVNISGNALMSVDLRTNTKLRELYANSNNFTAIDLENNVNLGTLELADNKISTIKLTKSAPIRNMNLGNNRLTSLDVSSYPQLETLKCFNNGISTLELGNITSLKILDVSVNALESLNVSYNKNLEELYCNYNELTTLDVVKNTNLKILKCENNSISKIDVNNASNLTEIRTFNNNITELNLSNNSKVELAIVDLDSSIYGNVSNILRVKAKEGGSIDAVGYITGRFIPDTGYKVEKVEYFETSNEINKAEYGNINSLDVGYVGDYTLIVTFIVDNIDTTQLMVNVPNILDGMIPIKRSGDNWVITVKGDPEWYDYSNNAKEWANVMLRDGAKYMEGNVSTDVGNKTLSELNGKTVDSSNMGSVFVWIPRYSYIINESGEMLIKFSNGLVDDTDNGYIVHPGFNFSSYNGGDTSLTTNYEPQLEESDKLLGFWVAKYPASSNSGNIASKNNTTEWTNISINDAFVKSKDMFRNKLSSYGVTIDEDNVIRYDSHLMKNVEWGAVSYLAKALGNIGETTTGNATGVYGMNSGKEFVASYIELVGGISNYSVRLNGTNLLTYAVEGYTNPETENSRYVDKVKLTSPDDTQANNLAKLNAYYGTATKETNGTAEVPYKEEAFFVRGENGIFDYGRSSGSANSSISFRPTILAEVVSSSMTTHQIASIVTGSGIISPEGTVTVNDGWGQRYLITPNDGYEIVEVFVDGISVLNELKDVSGITKSYTFTEVHENHIINVIFDSPVNKLNVTATVEPSDAGTVVGTGEYYSRSTVTLTAVPKPGYVFESWTVLDNTVNLSTLNNPTISFTMPSNNVLLQANFEKAKEALLRVEMSDVTFESMETVGKSISVEAIVDEGMEFTGWTATGITLDDPTNVKAEFIMPAVDVVLIANYKERPSEYMITWVNYDGTELAQKAVTYGEVPVYTGVTPTKPDTAQYTYTFSGWNPTMVAVTEEATYTAMYTQTLRSYTITATAGNGGTISPASATVEYNGNATFTIAQNNGYVLSSLKVDGNAVDTALSYTITNVQKATTITAEFSPISYTISYNLDGGTGSNPTSYTVETESFTLNEPTREGYTFTGWTGTGLSSATTSVTIAKGSTGNRNYTANWITNNVAPSTPTVTTSNKTTSSFVVSAVSTDTDGDSLTYTLYVGGSAKETKTASSGTTVTFSTVTGLSEYTTYSYYVTVTDGKATATSSTGSIRTKCSGTSLTCTTRYCSAGECSNCDGTGEEFDRCDGDITKDSSGLEVGTKCDICRTIIQYSYWKCSCGWIMCANCMGDRTDEAFDEGYTIDNAYIYATKHGKTITCTSCDGSGYGCSHKLSYSHRTCSHYSTTTLTSHKYCTHGKTSEHD